MLTPAAILPGRHQMAPLWHPEGQLEKGERSKLPAVGTAAAQYDAMVAGRAAILEEAHTFSELTLPGICPRSTSSELVQPWNGTGGEGVSHLASKFTLALFPPGLPFIRLEPDEGLLETTLEQLPPEQAEPFRRAVTADAAKAERWILRRFRQLRLQGVMNSLFQHLIVTGNALLFIGRQQRQARLIPLTQFVVQRSPSDGQVEEVLIREMVAPQRFPSGFLDRHRRSNAAMPTVSVLSPTPQTAWQQMLSRDRAPIPAPTRVWWDWANDRVHWWMEAFGVEVPRTRSVTPLLGSPWLVLRFSPIEGEDHSYGRGYQLPYSDLVVLNAMERATSGNLVEACRLILFVKRGMGVQEEDVANARHGSVLSGDAAAVQALQYGKLPELNTALSSIQYREARLQRMFAMPISIQRRGERVSSEEIRILANSLEKATTGFYGLFSEEGQPLIASRIQQLLAGEGVMGPPSQDSPFRVVPITGLNALGREDEWQTLMEFVNSLASPVFQQESPVAQYVKMPELVRQLAIKKGIKPEGLIKTVEELQEEQRQAQEAQQQAMAREQEQQAMAREQQRESAVLGSPVIGQAINKWGDRMTDEQVMQMLNQEEPDGSQLPPA